VIVDCAACVDGTRATEVLGLEMVPSFADRPDAFVWVGLRVPTAEQLAEVLGACGADPHQAEALLAPTTDRCEQDPDRLADGPAAVLAAVVGQVVDDYRPALDGLERAAVAVEKEVFDDSRSRPGRRVYALKRQVRDLLVAIEALHDPLARLARNRRTGWSEDVVDDLQEDVDQLGRAYGMNFEHMPELTWRFGYPLVLLLMGGACLALHRTFRKSGWL